MKAGLILIGVLILIALAPIGVMLAWQWVVPDVFAGAVTHGIIPQAITYWQAWKMIILLAILGISGRSTK